MTTLAMKTMTTRTAISRLVVPYYYYSLGLNYRVCWSTLIIIGLLSPVSVCDGREGLFDEEDRNIGGILQGADDFGNHMTEMFNMVTGTGIYDKQTDLENVEHSSSSYNVRRMLDAVGSKIKAVMDRKEKAVEELKASAERAMKDYGPYKSDINPKNVSDFNAKKVVILSDISPLSNETQKEIRETINYLPTEPAWADFKTRKIRPMLNTQNSSIHVPTNIYDKSMKILNGVKWTQSMTKQFVLNQNKDPKLTWQYFCSSDGFFRIYPGMQWPRDADKVDTFDCRVRQWYIQAATSPKNIIILLDTSGSMKGLRLSIAKSTVYTILDTLSDEDYFNVIQFSDEPQYVVDCFNGTLMPATVDNIRRMKGMIEGLEAKKYANFEKALVTAFELFKREYHLNHKKRICNRAIMLVTDGPPDSYDNIFDEYNWPEKFVRVFTFLIGKEVQDNRQARWMACANKGKFTHISTRADVQENVQKYVKVLSRPLAIEKAYHRVWTPVYLDYVTLQDDILAQPGRQTQLELDYEDRFKFKGLGLVMSVSVPVYDTRSRDAVGPTEEDPTRNMLGVAGVDLRINELKKLLPTFELGANGYAFAITNHGYILFHPDYKPFYTEQAADMFKLIPRPKYNSVELSEVERPASTVTQNEHREHPLSHFLLRSDKGEMQFTVVTHIDNMKYVENREQFYRFVEISNAFRLVFVIPNSYGFRYVRLKQTPNQTIAEYKKARIEDVSTMEFSYWIYCKSINGEGYQSFHLHSYDYLRRGVEYFFKKCDETHAQHILKDLIITSNYSNVWIGVQPHAKLKNMTGYKKCFDDKMQAGPQKMLCFFKAHLNTNGIEMLWIGTRSGVTRYIQTNQHRNIGEWKRQNTQTLKSGYYQRAVSLWDRGYKHVFSGPVSTIQKEFEFNNSYVTVARVEVVGSDSQTEVPAAVVAFQTNYSAFYETFVNYTFGCQQKSCSAYTCNDTEHFSCYIIDNNGYVLATNNPDKNGTSLFLGQHDGYLMRAMVDDSIFEEIQLTDFQSTCETKILSGQDNASNFMLNPLQILSKFLVWLFTETILLMSQLSIMTWNGISGVVGMEAQGQAGGDDECGQWIPEPYARYLYCGFVINSATGERKAASFVTQRRPCEQSVTRFNLNLEALKNRKTSNIIASCVRQCRDNLPSYQVRRLSTSNLLFVVSDPNCRCEPDPTTTTTSSTTVSDQYVPGDEVDEEEEEERLQKIKDRYTFDIKPHENTYLESEQCQRMRNLSEELKQVDETRLSNIHCRDSSSENDTQCNNASQQQCPTPSLIMYIGTVLVSLYVVQIFGIRNTSLR